MIAPGPRRLVGLSLLFLACGGAPEPPAAAPAPARACEEAYEDIASYFAADPERHRPPGLNAGTFVGACRELPAEAQRCMLFSYMQSHSAACDAAMSEAPPDLMQRLAAMAGK